MLAPPPERRPPVPTLAVRAVVRLGAMRLGPPLLVAWGAVLWFLANFGPLLDGPEVVRRLAAVPASARWALGAAWIFGWAALPRGAVVALVERDLAFLQRAPLRPVPRGGLVLLALVGPAAVPAVAGLLWPGGPIAAAGFFGAGLVALAALGRGRFGVALAAAAVGAVPGAAVLLPLVPWAVGRVAAAPAGAPAARSAGVRWAPRSAFAALLLREGLVAWRGERVPLLVAMAVSLPLGVLFRGFRRHSGWGEGTLAEAAAVALVVAGVAAGDLAGRLVVRLGWPPVPRAWPVPAAARLGTLVVVVAACLVPTTAAFAAVGVPADAGGGLAMAAAFSATSVGVAAAALVSRGRTLGVLLGWTAFALILGVVGGAGWGALLVAAAVLAGVAARAAGRP